MTVYVDKLRTYPDEVLSLRLLKHKKWCHMLADTSEELDNFAIKLSLKPSWKSNPYLNRISHYDLTENKRNQALRMGAIEISDEDLVTLIKKTRR